MSIAAVAMVLNEADIIETSIRHLFAEGIDEMYLAVGECDDNSWNIIESLDLPIHMYHDTDEVWHQAAWTNELIARAGTDGHEWIVPFDADEFVYATNSDSIADTLADCPHDNLLLHQWGHHSWGAREVTPRTQPKVAFRYSFGVTVSMGAHACSLPGGQWDVLDIREWQFLSFDHFCKKVRTRIATLDPVERARGNGWHMTRFDGKSDEEMRTEWEAIQAIPTIADPIPSRLPPGLGLVGQA